MTAVDTLILNSIRYNTIPLFISDNAYYIDCEAYMPSGMPHYYERTITFIYSLLMSHWHGKGKPHWFTLTISARCVPR